MNPYHEVCPECKGLKGYWMQISQYWEEHLKEEWHACPECQGEGTVHPLQMAIYKARGGTAPGIMKGFA